MPTLTAAERHPIVPATYHDGDSWYGGSTDPSTLSEGAKARAQRVLKRAKAIIEEKGWTQHTSTGTNGEKCLSAAISSASNVRSKAGLPALTSHKVQSAIVGLLETARPKVTRRAPAFRYMDSVVTWNDKSGRTKEQVLALLDKAIAI